MPLGNHQKQTVIIAAGITAISLAAMAVASGDSRVAGLIKNTLFLSSIVAAISVMLGGITAALLVRTDVPFRNTFLFLIGSMLFLPLYLQASAWDAGFGLTGWYTASTESATSGSGQVIKPILGGWNAVVWIHTLAALPWTVLLLTIGFLQVPKAVEELALLNATGLQVIRRVTFPLVCPSLLAAFVWISVTVAGEMTVTDMYRVRTYAEEIYLGFSLTSFKQAAANSASESATTPAAMLSSQGPLSGVTNGVVVTSLICLGLIATLLFVPLTRAAGIGKPLIFTLRRTRWLAMLGFALLIVGLAGVPLFNLIYKAGLQLEVSNSVPVRCWSLSRFAEVILAVPSKYGSDFQWTLLIASAATFGSLFFAIPLSWIARSEKKRNGLPALFVTAFGFAVPGPVIGIILIGLLNQESSNFLIWLYDRTVFAPACAMMIKSLPFAIVSSWWLFRNVPTDVLEVAEVAGMGKFGQLIHFGIRANAFPIAAIALLVMAINLGDLSASILVIPPGIETVQRRVFGLVHAGVDDQVAAICLAQWMLTLILVSLALMVWRFTQKAGGHQL